MKYSRIVRFLFCLVLILFISGCSNINEINLEGNTYTINKSFKSSFTVSFWIKPKSNYINTKILTISNKDDKVTLYNNSLDEDYLNTGLILCHDFGNIYKDLSTSLETYNYNFVTIRYIDNTFFLSLNGELIGEKAFKEFELKDLIFEFGSEDFIGDIKNIDIEGKYVDDKKVMTTYLKDIVLRLDNIDFDEDFKENAYGKVSLPSSSLDITYASDSNYLNIVDGYLLFNKNNEVDDKKVTLNVSTTINNKLVKKDIDFIIKGYSDETIIENVLSKVDNSLASIISESNKFSRLIDGCDISYEVIDGNGTFKDDHFIKTTDNDNEKIRVKVIVTLNDSTKEFYKDISLIDEYYAYLLVYFTCDSNACWYDYGDEKLNFALSKDKNNWTKLNIDIGEINKGSRRLRDPYIYRNDDSFIIVTTEGYNNPGIYLLKTNNLLQYDIKHVSFTNNDLSINLNGNLSYAPEIIYDDKNKEYKIIYSDPEINSKEIYQVSTSDFKNYSYPSVFYKASSSVIDGDISIIDGVYYLFYKNEDDLTIHYAYSLDGKTWSDEFYKSIDAQCALEGPQVLIDHINNKVYLYMDAYEENKIYFSEVTKNYDNSLDIEPIINDSFDTLGIIHHFSIIELTKDEYERLLDYE